MSSTKEQAKPTFEVLENTVWRNIQTKKGTKIFWLTVGLVLIAGSIGLVSLLQVIGLFNRNSAKTAPSVPVLTVTVQPASIQPINRFVTVNGSISAWDPISVGAEVNGLEVKSIFVEEGATVRKGQILATLNASLVKPQLESEEARLKASLANCKKAVQPNRPEDINALSAAVSEAKSNMEDQRAALLQAQANLLNAKQNETRYEYLHSEGATSLQELENRQTNAKVAYANMRSAEERIKAASFSLKQAEEHLSMAEIGGRAEDIQIANANIHEIRGNIKRLQAQLAQTIIKAPVDGLITKRDAHIGDISAVGKVMFLMARDSRLELRAQVPEADLAALTPGQLVTMTSALCSNETVPGKLREISPLVDSDTRLATVRIDIPMSALVRPGLKPGMYAEGQIELGKYPALVVPTQAVISQDDKSVVFVLCKNQVDSRPIKTGVRTNDQVEVTAGLRPKELVVIKGAGFLKDGDCVAVVPPAMATPDLNK